MSIYQYLKPVQVLPPNSTGFINNTVLQKGDFTEKHCTENIDPIDARRRFFDCDYRASRGLLDGMTKTFGKSGVRTRMSENVWLLVVCATFAVLAVAAVTVPRIAPHGQEGLAAAATAAVWFLLLGTLALVTSFVALVMTARAWRRLSVRMRAAGLSPAILSVVGILALVAAWGRSRDETPASLISPTTVTAPAAVDARKKQEAEQGVAPQSATRTESDSEGGDKLQPESEERSR